MVVNETRPGTGDKRAADLPLRILSYTPYYITLGEFSIAVLLALLAKHVSCGNLTIALLSGFAGGVGIFLCYALAYTSPTALSLAEQTRTTRLANRS